VEMERQKDATAGDSTSTPYFAHGRVAEHRRTGLGRVPIDKWWRIVDKEWIVLV
jgi:hypothetical protein